MRSGRSGQANDCRLLYRAALMRLGQHTFICQRWPTLLRRCLALLLPLAFLTQVSCARRAAEPQERIAKPIPAWTYRKPDDPEVLNGLGRAPIAGDLKRAKQTALALARDDLLQAAKDSTRRWVHQHAGEVETATVEALWEQVFWDRQELLIADVATAEWYEEPERARVWVLVSLERAEFERALDSHRQALRAEVESRLAKAETAKRRGNVASELTALSTALAALVGPEGLTIVSPAGAPRLLRDDVEAQLKTALHQVSVTVVEGHESLPPGVVHARLTARAADASGDGLDIPLSFSFIQGEGALGEVDGPDSRGRTTAIIEALDPRELQVIVAARPGLGALVDGDEVDQLLVDKATAQWDVPTAEFRIALIPVRLLLTYIERGGTGGERGSLLIQELGEAFQRAGVELVEVEVETLLAIKTFEAIAQGAERPDLSTLPRADLIGVAMVELADYEMQGRAPQMHAASGVGAFRLYAPEKQSYRLQVSTGELSFSGFSETDAERGFFFQASDRLRDQVINEIEGQDLLAE